MALVEGQPSGSAAPPSIKLAFATLFMMMSGHAILESARDALLLGSLSPSALLWSYVAIAFLAVLTTRIQRGGGALHTSAVLPSMLVGAAAVTAMFWLLLPRVMPNGALVFYVYTGILATLVVPRFWLLLSSRFTVGEAKRHYSTIGLGGVAGAVAGSALASFLLARISIRGLLIAGALMYVIAAVVARRLEHTAPVNEKASRRLLQARSTEPKAYVRRLTMLALVASATLTVVDYLFKSVAAATVPHDQLGSYFARVYTSINVLALIVQVFVVPRMLRVLGTHTAATVLPLLILAGSSTFGVVAAPLIVLATKAADGTLRNSLHRVTMELFYFPLPDDARNRWKAAADAFGQRGGQAVGALAMLGLLAIGAEPRSIAILAAVLAFGWVVLVQVVRRPYVELFRASLRRGSMPANVPPLGSKTLQAMLEALSSRDDAVVCGALDFLALHGNVHLLPAVMVHHPSPTVATRALDHLMASHREDVPQIIERLTTTHPHADPAICASAWRARMQRAANDSELLEAAREDPRFDVRATAIVSLLRRERVPATHRDQAMACIDEIVNGDCTEAKRSLARAIEMQSHPHPHPHPTRMPHATSTATSTNDENHAVADRRVSEALMLLIDQPDSTASLRREVLRAMVRVPDRAYLPKLQLLLGDRRLMPDARRAVIASSFGDSSVVEKWLCDESLPDGVRRHIPRTLSAFESEEAAAALLARWDNEPNGAVRFKILRGLGRMRADQPTLSVDKHALKKLAQDNLKRAIDILAWRVALDSHNDADGDDGDGDGDGDDDGTTKLESFLCSLLREKEERALERVFRVLGILHPEAELERVWRGIHSNDPRSRDASLELVDQLDRAERALLTAILETRRTDAGRLRSCGRRAPTREQALIDLSVDASLPLREIARFLMRKEKTTDHVQSRAS